MTQKILTILVLVLIFTGMIQANPKNVQLHKLKHTNIGNPTIAGTSTVINNNLQIIAGGADIWGTKDECRFYIL